MSHHCFDGKLSAKHDFGSGSAVLCCGGWWSAMVSLWCTLLDVGIYCLLLLDIYCLPLLDIYFLHFAVSVLHPTSRIESEGWF